MKRQVVEKIATAGLLIALSLPAKVSLGQAVTGSLLGTVLDTSGAVVPNANVTVTNQGTSVSNRMATGAQGFYTFPNLDPGLYNVTVEASGFKTVIAKDNVVQVQKAILVDLTLSPGAGESAGNRDGPDTARRNHDFRSRIADRFATNQ